MVFLDIILVVFVFSYIKSKRDISFLNPCFLYLLYHILFITSKSIQLFYFNSVIVSNYWYDTFVTLDEIEKALLASDISLIGFLLGFYLLKNNSKKLRKNITPSVRKKENKTIINIFLAIAFLGGVIGTVAFSSFAGTPLEEEAEKTNIFVSILTSLGVTFSLLLIYVKGFKRIYVVYFIFIIFIFSLQGYHRYRVLLPLIFLMSYYLRIKNLTFPPSKFIIIGIFVMIFSFPLKQIGKQFQNNEQIDLIKIGEQSIDELLMGESGDLSFLEQSAAMIGVLDTKDKVFYGQTYLPVLLFWVPRSVWNDKPKLNQWQHNISTSGRNFGEFGQISLLSGESYANFRYLGVFLIPFLISRFYSRLYFRYKNVSAQEKGFLLLLLFNMVLFQVWRDGVVSLIIFPFVNYLPILLMYFIKK